MIKNIAVGSQIPDKRMTVHNGEVVEIKKSYKIVNGQPVVIWDIEDNENFLIFKIKSGVNTINLRNLEASKKHEGMIYWGDSTSENYISTNEYNHSYSDALTKKEIKITAEIETLQDFAFDSMPIIEIKISSSVKNIGNSAFQSSDIMKIEIPDTVATIGSSAFQYCDSLIYCKLTENENYFQISSYMFYEAKALQKITFGNNIKYFLPYCFGYTSLSEIEFHGTVSDWNSITKYNGWNSGCGKITVKCNDGNVIE